jgi:AcrR family transcriptional regulator
MFGKPGRPPEDRVQRKREIWTAVAPLIEKLGVRNLTMRQAAAASVMSLGGLYHYFPNKRALVLFGTDQEALERSCSDFKARCGHLKDIDPEASVEAFVQFIAGETAFSRPAVLAALELGAEEFLTRLETNMTFGLEGFTQTLRLAVPDAGERDLQAVAKAVRRLFFAGLVDRSMTRREFEDDLRAVVKGMPVGRKPQLAGAG